MAVDERLGVIRENLPMYILAICVTVACCLLWASHMRAAEKADRLIEQIRLLRVAVEKKL